MRSLHALTQALNPVACRMMLCASLLGGALLHGEDLLRNGNFTDGLADWVVPQVLQGWTPLEAGGFCATDVEDWTYNSTIVTQNLNYTGVAGKQLTVSVDVRCDWDIYSPPAVLIIDYITNTGQRMGLELLEIQPGDVTTLWSTLQGSATLPSTADRVVAFSLQRMNGISIYFDNLVVQASGLVAGPLPELATVRPYVAAHGQAIALEGSGFGGAPGSVLLNGAPAGVSISSWADDRVDISLAATSGSGRLVIETAAGVRSSETRGVEVSSPYLQVGIPRDSVNALVGQTISLEAYVQAHNGYVPSGPIVLSCPERPGLATFSPATLDGSGGTTVQLDTTGLGAGQHTLHVQAIDGQGIPFSAPFSLEVLVLDHVDFSYYDSSYNRIPVTDSLTINEQRTIDTDVAFFAPGDVGLPYELQKLDWFSSDPAILQLYVDQWSTGPTLLPQANGTCTLTANGPGGFSRSYAVTVALPDSPKVNAISFSMNPIPNDGSLNYFFYANAVPSASGWSISGMLETDFAPWDAVGSALTMEFSLVEGHQPGKFLFAAGASGGASRGIVLEVVNAADKAQISGMIRLLDEKEQMHASGLMEFYDAATGTKVHEQFVFSHGKEYVASYLPPADYKVRFTPDSWDRPYTPVWHPNALDMADASVVSLSAGDALDNIHFFFLPALPPAPVPPEPVVDGGQLSLNVPTEAGALYVVEVSDSMDAEDWTVHLEFTGDGNVRQVIDDLVAAGEKRFYRVRKL